MLELASLQTASFICLNLIMVNRVTALNIRAESIFAAEPQRGTARSVTCALMNARTVRQVRERAIACTSIRAAMILFC